MSVLDISYVFRPRSVVCRLSLHSGYSKKIIKKNNCVTKQFESSFEHASLK